MDDYTLELVRMADMYASKCTRQEEKFNWYRDCGGISWRWEDCEAAYILLKEQYTFGQLYDMRKATGLI